jgi:RimJ/RimL family protein N-acetyltransferase
MGIWSRVWRRLSRMFNETFRRRHHVYRFERAAGPACPGLVLDRYDRPEAVPEDARRAVLRWGGEPAWRTDVEELRDGAALWIGRLDGVVAGAWMSRPGALFRAWFVPLRPEDRVLFRGTTAPELRGRGLSPAMMREIVAREVPPGGRAYVDASVHNASSIRAIEKAGFRRIATLKPVTRNQAYA